ncbi:hypothetical protein CEXT_462831 [Caerostris extrusa]|uniref:Uncharacterized protein n=1 Tax=Caerostris extrusa TaxID=172846 RepID=A0AAV4PQB7_CAEEX|nr:hypothetical protein CEXT_462831 [Caerostris extrusa]
MYRSTDKLVSNEQGVARDGYQSVEDGGPVRGSESNINESPPTFLSQVKRAREENIGCCKFCMAFFALLIGSIVWTLFMIVIATVPIIMIVIGAKYFHDCPVQKMIPISAIVAGCVSLLSNVINLVDRCKRLRESGRPKRHTVIGWVNVVLNLFLAAWFIATCYWVYSAPVEFKDETSENYCHPHLFGFMYWLLNFIFIFFGVMVVVSALIMYFALTCW